MRRYEEDWPARPADGASVLERVKHLPLGGGAYLSLGGEARFTYEFVDNANYGAGPQDGDGYLLQRYHLHADLHLSPAFRFFGELKSGLENGRTGGPRPIDEDVLDLHQMFGDVRGEWDDGSATLRPGRQELSFGSGRLITVRQGPNVRLSFDAIRGIVQHRELRVDVFAARPVETDRDAFDNSAEADYWVWGVYGTARTPAGQWDVYYLGSDRPNVVYARGRGGETRHTVGSRLSGRRGSWDYNVEAAVQGGDFEGTSIFAWMVSSESGVTLETAVPVRAGLKADAYSGDGGGPGSGRSLGTFSAPFAKGAYFGEVGVTGASNVLRVGPSLDVYLTPTWVLTGDVSLFWRASEEDGVYGIPGNLSRQPMGSDRRFVAAQYMLASTWYINRHLTLYVAGTYVDPGGFISDTGPSEAIFFSQVQLGWRF